MQAVMNRHGAAALRYAVRFSRGHIIVIVVLVCLCGELVLAVRIIHRISQQIGNSAVRPMIEIDFLYVSRTETADLHLRFTQALLLQAEDILLERQLYRRAVDTVIDGIVVYRIAAAYRSVVLQRCVGQVESLGGLTGSEKRRIARSRRLDHFVFDREQIDGILAGIRIGMNGDAFLLSEHRSRTYSTFWNGAQRVDVIYHLRERILYGIAREVLRVVHQMGGVVAFELENERQVVAEVVMA